MKISFLKKCKWITGLLLCISLFHFADVSAQVKITGKITEQKNGLPLEGASVQEKGTRNGTLTDKNGSFILTVKSLQVVLEISAVGFERKEIKAGGKSNLEISLEESVSGLNDVVVIGYQSVQRRNTTAAISSIKGKDFENTPYPTFDAMLQGRVAGLNVLSTSGEPGGNFIVNIRGNTAISDAAGNADASGTSAPLYVIDGIVVDVSDIQTAYGNSNPLSSLNPNDIESIDVLKDASAAAIYGARAGNGVIIVKTKRPKGGKPQLRLSSYVGLSSRPALKPVIVGKGERQLKYDLLAAQNNYLLMSNISQLLTDSLNPAFNNNTDFQGLVFRDAIIQNYDASIAGAEERFAYRLSLNRYVEQGTVRGYDISRNTPRVYLSLKPYKGIEIVNDLYMGFTKATHGSGIDGNPNVFGIQNFPSSFWRLDDVNIQSYKGRNDQVRDDDRTTSINGSTRLIANLSSALTFTSSVAYNFGFSRRDLLQPISITGTTNDATTTSINSRRWEIENYLTYSKTFGEHFFTGLIGTGAEDNVINRTNGTAKGIPLGAIQTINGVPPGPGLTFTTSFQERTRASLFARVGYVFKNRYGVDLSYRRDASSRYTKSKQWAEFPAASARWTISEEPFFKPMLKYISFLKIRGSFGSTGTDPGDYYAQYRKLTLNNNYTGYSLTGPLETSTPLNTYNGIPAVVPNYLAYAPAFNITWQRSPQSNIGFDMNFLDDRFTLTADYYIKNSKDIVFNVPVPITTGYTGATNNYVDVRNTGLEIAFTSNNLSRKSVFKWTSTINIAFNKNYVTKLPANNRDFIYGPAFLQRILTVGQPVNSFMVFNAPYIYPTTADVPVDPLSGRRLIYNGSATQLFGGGDAAKQDRNGDYNIDIFDKIIGGDPNPRLYGGFINNFAYKGFSLQVLTSFVSGRSVWNSYLSDKFAGIANNPYSNWGLNAGPAIEFKNLNTWKKPGDIADLPNIFNNNVGNTGIQNTYFVQDASFVRIKSLLFGYVLPTSVSNRLKLKSIRLFSNIDNLLVAYKADLPDPEPIGADGFYTGQGYPVGRKFTIGLEINL